MGNLEIIKPMDEVDEYILENAEYLLIKTLRELTVQVRNLASAFRSK